MRRPVPALLILAVSVTGGPAVAGDWRIVGRGGDCIEIADMARRKPVLAGIRSPSDLIAHLQGSGKKVKARKVSAFHPAPVSVHAPEYGLSLMFVPKDLCEETAAKAPR